MMKFKDEQQSMYKTTTIEDSDIRSKK